jgi:hypothetical protein
MAYLPSHKAAPPNGGATENRYFGTVSWFYVPPFASAPFPHGPLTAGFVLSRVTHDFTGALFYDYYGFV